MRNSKVWWLAAAVCVFGLGGVVLAQAKNKIDDKTAFLLGKDVVKNARPTGQKITFVEYKEDSSEKKRLVMNIKMSYLGKATKKKYNANIKLTLDTSSNPPKAVDVEYKDDNKVPVVKKVKAKARLDALSKKLPKEL